MIEIKMGKTIDDGYKNERNREVLAAEIIARDE